MKHIYVPSTGVNDWQNLLADPTKHWKEGYSAMEVAKSWEAANGFPAPIASVLKSACEPIHSLQPLLIFPEHQVALPGGSAASQSDVWVLASHSFGLASITVEGKVSETFGPPISKWLVGASADKHTRLEFLAHLLGKTPADFPGTIRYQLLHRVGSAILEAKRFRANVALCIIQSFSKKNAGWADFEAFCKVFKVSAHVDEVVRLGQQDGITFYASWVRP
jgi:hypothetical protein